MSQVQGAFPPGRVLGTQLLQPGQVRQTERRCLDLAIEEVIEEWKADLVDCQGWKARGSGLKTEHEVDIWKH